MRFENWPELLNDYLSRDHVFDWSTCNCALFAANGVLEITGHDFAKKYRGPKTKRGIINRLVKLCGGDVETVAIKSVGDPLDNVRLAQRGDVLSFNTPDGPALGICNGAYGVFISEQEGKIKIPLDQCRFAWRIS